MSKLLAAALMFVATGAMASHNGPTHRDSWTIAGVCADPNRMRDIMGLSSQQSRIAAFQMLVSRGVCSSNVITITEGCLYATNPDHPMGEWRMYRVVSKGGISYSAIDASQPIAAEIEAWSDGPCTD